MQDTIKKTLNALLDQLIFNYFNFLDAAEQNEKRCVTYTITYKAITYLISIEKQAYAHIYPLIVDCLYYSIKIDTQNWSAAKVNDCILHVTQSILNPKARNFNIFKIDVDQIDITVHILKELTNGIEANTNGKITSIKI